MLLCNPILPYPIFIFFITFYASFIETITKRFQPQNQAQL